MAEIGAAWIALPLLPVGPTLREHWFLVTLYGEKRDAPFFPFLQTNRRVLIW